MPALARLFLAFTFCLASATAVAQSAPAGIPAASPDAPLRVLFVGNSLTYANNLPRLVRAVSLSQAEGPKIETATYAIPGAELLQLWDDGHAAAAIREGHWDAVVLQERGGVLECLATNGRDPGCRRSERAHRHFADVARQAGARVLLLMSWPPLRGNDLGDSQRRRRNEEKLANAYASLTRHLSGDGATVAVVPAATALYEYGAGRPATEVLVDGVHPSVPASLVMAAQLYAAISGRQPQATDLMIDFPLLPPNAMIRADAPMETQKQIAGDGSRVLLKADAVAPYYAAAAAR
jgi:hypothetical protein